MLGDAPTASSYDVRPIGGIVKGPVHKAGAVEAIGPVCAGSRASRRPDLRALSPSGIGAEDKGLAAPKVCDLTAKRQGVLYDESALR